MPRRIIVSIVLMIAAALTATRTKVPRATLVLLVPMVLLSGCEEAPGYGVWHARILLAVIDPIVLRHHRESIAPPGPTRVGVHYRASACLNKIINEILLADHVNLD
jgi:hypothetical protein